jgi:hypothetical protein
MSASYYPPIENVPIFDPVLFIIPNENQFLTRADGNKYYLEYPIAQGSETFTNLTITQNAIISGDIIINGAGNYIQFPDGTQQTTVASTPLFQPRFTNYSQNSSTNTGSGAYIPIPTPSVGYGPTVLFNGTWTKDDYVIFRVSHQASWGDTGNGWNNYASTSGILMCRPYYMTGNWTYTQGEECNLVYPINSYNIKTAVGYPYTYNPVKGPLYYSGIKIQGKYDYFQIIGTDNYMIISFNNPDYEDWETTLEMEYMCRTPSGGTITFIPNHSGANNTLP